MSKLSSRQQKILEYIKAEVRHKGYPPSVREIGEAVGLASSSTVHGHLDRLEKKGFIRRDPTKPRAIEITDGDSNYSNSFAEEHAKYVSIPLLGKVTAGVPITAIEQVDEYMPLPHRLVGNEPCFILSVVGDSMIDAGIHHGDYAIIRQQNNANNGEIVVAMNDDDEATIKTFYKEKDHFRLQPENPTMEPIRLNKVTILGKLIGLIRSFR